MALSDLVVRQAKATGKAYTLPDIDGLSLAVTATGSKSWHFRYYWMKEPKRMSLGTYPEVSFVRHAPCVTRRAPCGQGHQPAPSPQAKARRSQTRR